MLKSCSYCGRIHRKGEVCPRKPKRFGKDTRESRFRNSASWQKKREQIRERDHYLCRMCLREERLTYDRLQVHHIVPLAEDWEGRLEDNNLIVLCPYHHELAEAGRIPREELREMATPRGEGEVL